MTDALLILFVVLITFIVMVHLESQLTDFDNQDPIDFPYKKYEIYGTPNTNVGLRVKISNLSTINPEELGTYLEGDMLLPFSKKPMGRNGLSNDVFRWPGGIVPIEIRGPFSKSDMNIINSAIESYHRSTCIRFKQHDKEKDFIVVQNTPTGCWANVGRTDGGQTINLQSPGCVTKIGTVQHEMMHALGFLHEQNREDRDNYVIINWKNIPTSSSNNFKAASHGSTKSFNVPYDYGSVMHYSQFSFAIDSKKPTILAKDSKYSFKMGQRDGFSSADIKKIWKMYKCSKPTSAGEGHLNKLSSLDNLGIFVSNFLGIGDEEEIAGM